jgi:hypothetical protein
MDDSKLTVSQKSENMLFRHSGESRNPVLPLAGFQTAANSLDSGFHRSDDFLQDHQNSIGFCSYAMHFALCSLLFLI